MTRAVSASSSIDYRYFSEAGREAKLEEVVRAALKNKNIPEAFEAASHMKNEESFRGIVDEFIRQGVDEETLLKMESTAPIFLDRSFNRVILDALLSIFTSLGLAQHAHRVKGKIDLQKWDVLKSALINGCLIGVSSTISLSAPVGLAIAASTAGLSILAPRFGAVENLMGLNIGITHLGQGSGLLPAITLGFCSSVFIREAVNRFIDKK